MWKRFLCATAGHKPDSHYNIWTDDKHRENAWCARCGVPIRKGSNYDILDERDDWE